ncbi:MAG: TetR family transcriptional regulator C-terminal domain-containing protein [Pseudomonadota bacterium]|nr:TetR family transcriptional regulator C-terminal domain-containing protein [Pseudomonadota bacterium]
MADLRTAVLAKRRAEMMDVISAAALEQFSMHGLRGTSTQEIAERAGISKQQLHYYIESKDVLYESILRRTMQHWGQIGLKTEDKTATPAEAITRLVRRKLDFTFDHPQVSRLFSYEVMSGGAAIRRIWAESADSVDAAVRIIAEWVRKREIEPIEPMFLLFHIWALTQHYADYEPQVRFFTGCPPGQALDRERICAQITCFVLRGVGLGSAACADSASAARSQRRLATPPAPLPA